ncbi:MAG: hypothetical protein KDA89_19230 [Planctomycetaceae bacterium]|nr:hypothetical protein [Planctomycetaceae bacterium]
MMAEPQTTPNTDSATPPEGGGRSYVLEAVGLLSAVGFFIGVVFAFQTNAAGLISQREFDRIEVGQTVADVNALLGISGTAMAENAAGATASPKEANAESAIPGNPRETYTWQNSSDSLVECTFQNGRLIEKHAVNLP